MTETLNKEQAAQAEILHHAEALFRHYGYSKTNIGEIAECCGMSAGNLYRYFRNKQGIGEEVVRRYLEQSRDAMQEAAEAATGPEAKLRAMLQAALAGLIAELRQNPRMVELADMICQGDSGILLTHVSWKLEQVRTLIDEGVAQGIFAAPDTPRAAQAFLDACRSFLAPPALAQMDLEVAPARLEAMMDLMFCGLRS